MINFRESIWIKAVFASGAHILLLNYFQGETIASSLQVFYQEKIKKSTPYFFKLSGSTSSIDEDLRYCDAYDPRMVRCGLPFNESWIPLLERFNLSDKQTARMTREDDVRTLSKYPTFITAFSDNHYAQAVKRVIPEIRLITSNDSPIIVYDLGLSASNLEKLRNLTAIEIRKFNFSEYPSYVRDLFQFRWKPLIIADALLKDDAVFYADSHFYWTRKMSLSQMLEKVQCKGRELNCTYSSAVFLCGAKHSIFAITDPKMYHYLPLDAGGSMKTEMGHAAILLFYNTRAIRSEVMKWFVLCALERECMAPTGSVISCPDQNEKWRWWYNCHRQDQSALSIILARHSGYIADRYRIWFADSRYS